MISEIGPTARHYADHDIQMGDVQSAVNGHANQSTRVQGNANVGMRPEYVQQTLLDQTIQNDEWASGEHPIRNDVRFDINNCPPEMVGTRRRQCLNVVFKKPRISPLVPLFQLVSGRPSLALLR